MLPAFCSTDHSANLYSSVTPQQYFHARIFMCISMDYETDTPIFGVTWSLNSLLAIKVNGTSYVRNLVAGALKWHLIYLG